MATLTMRLRTPDTHIPVVCGRHLWPEVTAFLAVELPGHRVAVIADDTVAELHGEAAREALARGDREPLFLTFPAGETSKSRAEKARLEDALLDAGAGRDTAILALGGGVTGDLAGFVAATLHRGVPLVHLPTSLLAQVDSGIGGKVGINHPTGKNLIGAFYQARAVFADTAWLDTLPDVEFSNGMAEVIKYAVILDDELWGWLEDQADALLARDPVVLDMVIARCMALKARVVEADEREGGYRSILNWGHTVAHAIEQLARYRVRHGFAVAAGMRVAARLSERLLGYPGDRVARLETLIVRYGLTGVSPADYDRDQLWERMTRDKKARRAVPRFTLMRRPGEPALFHAVEKRDLYDALDVS